jgi:hypothetical protein
MPLVATRLAPPLCRDWCTFRRMVTPKKGSRPGPELDESGVEFFAVLVGAPTPKKLAAIFARAGWSTQESRSDEDAYELEHTWADLDVRPSGLHQLTLSGSVLPSHVDELRQLIQSNCRSFSGELTDLTGDFVDTIGVAPPDLDFQSHDL